jgi:hypothetical protein
VNRLARRDGPPAFLWKKLTIEEAGEHRQWARENYHIGNPIDPLWHPIVQNECRKMNEEAKLLTTLYNDVERELSLALQPGTHRENVFRLVAAARDNLRRTMIKMGWKGQF